MIWQMAIAIALLGFNDLRPPVTPTFLLKEKDFIYNKVQKISRFLSRGHGIPPSLGCKARETMIAKCELVL